MKKLFAIFIFSILICTDASARGVTPPTIPGYLYRLRDTEITNPEDDHRLIYSNGKWINSEEVALVNSNKVLSPNFINSSDIDIFVTDSDISFDVNFLDISSNEITKAYFDITNGEPTLLAGEMAYNQSARIFDLGLGNGVTISVGQELVANILNKTGSTISDGTPYGEIWLDSDLIYVSPYVHGWLTKYKPDAPYQVILVGSVITARNTNGAIAVRPTWTGSLKDLYDVNGTPLTEYGQLLIWEPEHNYFDFTRTTNDFHYRHGLANRTDSTISYDFDTQNITVSGTWYYWFNGIKYLGDAISETNPDTTDTYYLYYDSNNEIYYGTTPWNIITDVPISSVYYNADSNEYILFDERHSSDRNRLAHYEFHYNIGAYWHEEAGELYTIKLLENDPNVKYFDRCKFRIPYTYLDKNRFYYPDFMVEYNDGSKIIIEVKPSWKLRHKKYRDPIIAKNIAANKYAKKRGMVFLLFTEKIFIKGGKL